MVLALEDASQSDVECLSPQAFGDGQFSECASITCADPIDFCLWDWCAVKFGAMDTLFDDFFGDGALFADRECQDHDHTFTAAFAAAYLELLLTYTLGSNRTKLS